MQTLYSRVEVECSDADLVAAQACRGSAGGYMGGPVYWQLHSIPLHIHTIVSSLHACVGAAVCRHTGELCQTMFESCIVMLRACSPSKVA